MVDPSLNEEAQSGAAKSDLLSKEKATTVYFSSDFVQSQFFESL